MSSERHMACMEKITAYRVLVEEASRIILK
jgi:hypothetical protein